jgi:hypothetical protein
MYPTVLIKHVDISKKREESDEKVEVEKVGYNEQYN